MKDGIAVNAVAPSLIDTDMMRGRSDLAARIPLGRLGHSEEVAQAVLMVLGKDYMTGQTIMLNGGMNFDLSWPMARSRRRSHKPSRYRSSPCSQVFFRDVSCTREVRSQPRHLEAAEGIRDLIALDAVETARQHGGILDRHRRALRHVGGDQITSNRPAASHCASAERSERIAVDDHPFVHVGTGGEHLLDLRVESLARPCASRVRRPSPTRIRSGNWAGLAGDGLASLDRLT